MKRYFGLIVLIAGIVLAAVMSYRSASAKAVAAQREADFTRLQKDYLERVGWLRTNPDEASYRQEVAPFFKAYFEDVTEYRNRYKLGKEFDAYLEELDKRAEKDDRAQDKKAFYEYTRKVFDQMREGRYKPQWSATDKGMRLDVLSSDVVMVLNKPQVRLQLVLWGAQREERQDGKVKKMVTSASFKTQWKLTDEKGKLIGEMSGEDPSMKIDFPERFIAEFPPQMVLGHYDMDLVPSEVKKMEITFNVSSRSSTGGDAAASYVWKLDVPSGWRLGAGEKWEGAEVSERPEEEIDPSKAAQKK
ncbi:hypothetical protein [Vitiosangium sp. GDMCC 1.1324]|uniref:hypothetical protein n=1 Tax=Vitiosangium sp. (strain GDMCC 1.1324) TaxID=2138576 RepID=UPI000D37A546|nr:hypothetical protein [Vitiosangium sp. GDMCC 1.1324]PTL85343.1 hypothetical protein DAT35_01060 [Vitiosangium sp. GDMCC 1.1324]